MNKQAKFNDLRSLSDAELIATILSNAPGSSLRQAEKLLETFGLQGIAKLPAGCLAKACKLSGFKALKLAAAFEVAARCRQPLLSASIQSSRELYALMDPLVSRLRHEEVWVVTMDNQSNLLARMCVGRGGLSGCGLFARDILREVLMSGASSFALVHNHPSGDTTPSDEDLHLTQGILAAASLVGLSLVDHLIVGARGYLSMRDLGLLFSGGDTQGT